MTILFFDTETTGLIHRGRPLDDREQPRVVQMAMILTDNKGRIIRQFSVVYNPALDDEGIFQIDPRAEKVHGISTAFAAMHGRHQKHVSNDFLTLARSAEWIIAHNVSFDMDIINMAALRSGVRLPDMKRLCTMKLAKDIMKLPPTEKMKQHGYTSYKNPSLSEAYLHYTGSSLTDAHDALVDASACREIFLKMEELGQIGPEGPQNF